mmetsp:Transcript_69811/g.214078  ORF Transcript_69811/g.214078 Transcript_69811/m.214078 type:complete len:239 (-) Transcript_69811:1150-1866(-)
MPQQVSARLDHELPPCRFDVRPRDHVASCGAGQCVKHDYRCIGQREHVEQWERRRVVDVRAVGVYAVGVRVAATHAPHRVREHMLHGTARRLPRVPEWIPQRRRVLRSRAQRPRSHTWLPAALGSHRRGKSFWHGQPQCGHEYDWPYGRRVLAGGLPFPRLRLQRPHARGQRQLQHGPWRMPGSMSEHARLRPLHLLVVGWRLLLAWPCGGVETCCRRLKWAACVRRRSPRARTGSGP